ncbi:MAG TPA: hypothetical protein PLQ56_13960 [Aggregatilineales bacterium]|nr:hypothetical protein [Aggregatilineales bacterium]
MTSMIMPVVNTILETDSLPVVVSKKWYFPLGSTSHQDKTYFAVHDWIAGLTGAKAANVAKTWNRIKTRNLGIKTIIVQHVTGKGRQVERPYTTDAGLFLITVYLRETKDRHLLKEIKNYLANAGATVDLLRRDTEARARLGATAGPEAVIAATVDTYRKHGQPDSWIQTRLVGAVSRVDFVRALTSAVVNASDEIVRTSTEQMYKIIWKGTVEQLRANRPETQGEMVRDHFGEMALIYTRLAERIATQRLKDAETVSETIAMDVVYSTAQLISKQAKATSLLLNMDLITERVLISSEDDCSPSDVPTKVPSLVAKIG